MLQRPSIGGLVKHATYFMSSGLPQQADDAMSGEAGFALFMGSFALSADESLEGALAAFDTVRWSYLSDVRSTDPSADMTAPPAPWSRIYAPFESVQRFALGTTSRSSPGTLG